MGIWVTSACPFPCPSFFVRLTASIVQPCAERVLLTLSTQYKDVVTPILQASFSGVAGV